MDTWDKRNATGQPSLLDKLELTGLPLRGCMPYQLEIKDEKDHLCFEATVARNVSKVQGVKFWWIQATKFAAKILQSNSSVSAQLKDGAMEHAKVCEELKDWIEEVGMQDDAWPKGQSGWVHLRSALDNARQKLTMLHEQSEQHNDDSGWAELVEDARPQMNVLLDEFEKVALKRRNIALTITGPTDLLQACCDALDATHANAMSHLSHGLKCRISPMSRITLGAEELRQMGVAPERARYYSFFYPCIDLQDARLTIEKPLQALVTIGGFVYFDAKGLLVSCNTFTPEKQSTTLRFAPAKQLSQKVSRALMAAERFQEVTIPGLQDQGCKNFAWLMGYEQPLPDGEDSEQQRLVNQDGGGGGDGGYARMTRRHGAFCYTTTAANEDDSNASTVFLALQSSSDEHEFDVLLSEHRKRHAENGGAITDNEWEALLEKAHKQLMRLSTSVGGGRSGDSGELVESLLKKVDDALREAWVPEIVRDRARASSEQFGSEIVHAQHVFELVNRSDPKDSRTPIKCAVEAGQLGVVKALIRHGADLRRKDMGSKQGSKLNLSNVNGSVNDTLMELAAKLGHYEIAWELSTECWSYTDLKTSEGAGRAVDFAFGEALRQQRWAVCIRLMLACWLRNDKPSVQSAVCQTLEMAVKITKAINRRVRMLEVQNGDHEKLEWLEQWARRAQLTAAGLMQKLSQRDLDQSLTFAWHESLLKDAVEAECLDLLGRATLHGFFRRQWMGRLSKSTPPRGAPATTCGCCCFEAPLPSPHLLHAYLELPPPLRVS